MGKQYIKATYNENGEKLCTNCKVFKDFSNFHKRSASPDGIVSYCKACTKENDRKKNEDKLVRPRKMVDELIHCRNCEQYLDESKFWGKLTYCKQCSRDLGHSGNLKKYGMSVDDYITLEKAQNGVCKTCKQPEKQKKRLSVDHDHACCPGANSCGRCIRGLLCSRCNNALGMVMDDINILQNMINYLK